MTQETAPPPVQVAVTPSDLPAVTDFLFRLSRLRTFASAHLTYTVALGTFLLVAFQVFGVARFNTTVTLGLLANTDPGRVLFGLFVSLIPTLATFWAAASSMGIGVALATRRLRAATVYSLAAPVFLLAIAASLFQLFTAAMICVPAVFLGWWVLHSSSEPTPKKPPPWMTDPASPQLRDYRASTYLMAVPAMAVGAIVALFGAQPWMPMEAVTVGNHEVVAYVVNDDGRWATLLARDQLALTIVRSDEVTARTVCRTSHPSGRTLVELLFQPGDTTPTCKES